MPPSTETEHGLDLPPADIGSCVKVIIGTTRPKRQSAFEEHRDDSASKVSPKEKGGMTLKFRSGYFRQASIQETLPGFVDREAGASSGLIMIIVENWHAWAENAFQAAVPRISPRLLAEVNNGLSIAMLPTFDDHHLECCSIMDHVDIAPAHDQGGSRGSMRMGDWNARREAIGTWTSDRETFPQYPDRPVAVIFGGSPNTSLSEKLKKHYLIDGPRRWQRLNECLHWLYLDVFFVFTNWDSTLEVARMNLEPKELQLFNAEGTLPIVRQTRELHRDTSTTLAMLESIRLHQASLKQYQRALQRMTQSGSIRALQFRLEDVAQLLDYYATTSLTIVEQQRNLLNLLFNIETVTQSQAVARINALAFFFLPLTFVAGIFGITTMDTPAKWYPVAAVPVLLLTVGVAYGLHRVSSAVDSHRHFSDKATSPKIPMKAPRIPNLPILTNGLQKSSHRDNEAGHMKEEREFTAPQAAESAPPPPTVLVDDVDPDLEWGGMSGGSFIPLGSSMALGFRVRGVARVDSDHLTADRYAGAAAGALRSPSGSLRHY